MPRFAVPTALAALVLALAAPGQAAEPCAQAQPQRASAAAPVLQPCASRPPCAPVARPCAD